MRKRTLIRNLLCWLKYRKGRKEQAARAASLAVQLVLNGCLAPPRMTGTASRIEKVILVSPPPFQAMVGPGGVA